VNEPEVPGPPTLPAGLEARRTETGLEIFDVAPGAGNEAVDGATLEIHCRGWLTDGTPVEDTVASGEPASFTLGAGLVIPGFDEGLLGLRVGGRRRLIVPSDLAYGSHGHPPRIPPYATLIYDVELLRVR
jgi:peptidylprolyl isomerase